jgi:hypothetical protein
VERFENLQLGQKRSVGKARAKEGALAEDMNTITKKSMAHTCVPGQFELHNKLEV